ncbi:hypothetical protein [Enterococcus mundtii]|uniref:hypothetical protein n=1 Tax=Enterococcus mundtii TaxID=53346 RepID=UPI000DFAA419|nr:hypothetical protein [Enterococcus mundtii]STE38126.1 Uncharacterised protein [Enterococcus mundtii]
MSRLKKKSKKSVHKKSAVKQTVGFKGESGFTYPFGYKEDDAYLFVGKKTVISVFDVLFHYGTNSPAAIGWLLCVIPKENIENGDVQFVQRQQGMDVQTEANILDKHLNSNIATIGSTKIRSEKARAQASMKIHDMRLAGELAGVEDSIVDSDIRMIVKAKTPEAVESIIEELQNVYKNYDVKGIKFIRQTGNQLSELKNLFTEVSSDPWHSSDMSTTAAGKLFFPSSGFSDPMGSYIGTDLSALISNNPSVVDFTGINNAVIFMGGINIRASVGGLEGAGMIKNGGSAVGHAISEANYLSGKRIHHIVLNKFDYRAEDNLIFDMTKEAINPLEVFGTPESVQQDANANFSKATTMMLMPANTISPEKYAKLEADLKSILIDWMIYTANNNGMYTANPEDEPTRARRILATSNHENYPTPREFVAALNSYESKSSNRGELAWENASYLAQIIKNTFTEYPNVFHKKTTLPDIFTSNDRNIYYDISGYIEDKKIAGAVFLNVLAYVTNRALEGEQIVIHGLDSIDVPIDILLPYRERIERKNIGLITIFEKSENAVNPSTYSKFVGRLSRQDMVVLGGITEDELKYINQSWQKNLSPIITNYLLQANNGALYFYRKKDRVSALVDTHLIL